MTARESTRGRVLAMVLLVALVGVLLAPPATAHVSSNAGHNWSKHYRKLALNDFYTKNQANNRFAPKVHDHDDLYYTKDEIDALPGGGGWGLQGNAGTSAGTDFLGTIDDEALDLRVNGERALRLVPDPSSPSLVGGWSGNLADPGTKGATIGGGGCPAAACGAESPNQVAGDFGTVAGGFGNTADAPHATVGGGTNNTAAGLGFAQTVAGGTNNSAEDFESTVGGGAGNRAQGSASTVSGGSSNQALGNTATVGGGYNNAAVGNATVAGGQSNSASDENATVGGGSHNVASGRLSVVPGGEHAIAFRYGEMAHASGGFGNFVDAAGTAQSSQFVLRRETSDEVPGFMSLGQGNQISLSDGQTLTFDGLLVARSDDGASAGYRIEGVIERVEGVTSLVGAPTIETLAEDDASWDVNVLSSGNALVIQVTGAEDTSIRWVGTVRTAQVTF